MLNTVCPTFAQGLDSSRPHTLLTEGIKVSGSLLYRYDDTREEVTVPNIWFNQPFQIRAASLRWQAQRQEDAAARYESNPQPYNLEKEKIAAFVDRMRGLAAMMRAKADRLEATGDIFRPVFAVISAETN